ncbi:MAG: bifunctional alpha,alpha-trehalose-phosphate synthase (UDP-forming)/trehalose-phosphatase [Candidatus Leucobacter sulfamidivorax]|nr:bifunctional alpha,alpha-trehalose-phosphate synthase (UDP-forming)/trehalose-phosphatase [Candidatus Leucobacter sulfamidivorax]
MRVADEADPLASPSDGPRAHDLVVVSNRLPVDRVVEDGVESWRRSPGGLVTAMESVVSELGCVWVGWPGSAGEEIAPFELGPMLLKPVMLDEEDLEAYYEGFSNDTLWPLYHDVISPPGFHREWWDRYVQVNRRFAEAAAEVAAPGATVWVHDYQLQLVPAMLRELRPDLVIAFFLHIPFPSLGLFRQLPWRTRVLEGLLGADVIGFQRVADAANFRSAARRLTGAPSHGNLISLPARDGAPERRVLAQEFPISIDAREFDELARSEAVQRRAREIREGLGDPRRVILGVDRLDYTKGIRHRLKAFDELLRDGQVAVGDVTLVQVASPSRERVEAYRLLRDEIEITVSRINGDYGTIGHVPVVYLHRGFPREEMAALYVAADVLAVTALRDGMNLVAKEYVACRFDERGALLLSEFTGAADELRRAVLVNPHDIDGIKARLLDALNMPEREQAQRMRSMRRIVFRQDVSRWSHNFLRAVESMAAMSGTGAVAAEGGGAAPGRTEHVTHVPVLPENLDAALRRLVAEPELLIACDFDGTLAPIVPHPDDARVLPRAEQALEVLQEAPGVRIAVLSGRSLESLAATGLRLDGRMVAGSHGSEISGIPTESGAERTADEEARLEQLLGAVGPRVAGVEGAWIERKPFGFAVHTRGAASKEAGDRLLDELADAVRNEPGVWLRDGKRVREFSVRRSDKGEALRRIREMIPAGPVLFIGDDITDEDALRALGPDDVGVHVGSGESVAEYRVDGPESVAVMLARLAELRCGVVIASE